jgi:hypothetical protein
MLWVSGTAVAFVVLMLGVSLLARSSTARWERDERARRARRRRAVAPRAAPPGAAVRLRQAVVRAAGPGVRAARVPLTALAPILTTARAQVLARRRFVPHVRQAHRSAERGGGASAGGVNGVATRDPEPGRGPQEGRPGSRAARVRHGFGQGLRHPARRLPSRLMHRHALRRSPTGAEKDGPAP